MKRRLEGVVDWTIVPQGDGTILVEVASPTDRRGFTMTALRARSLGEGLVQIVDLEAQRKKKAAEGHAAEGDINGHLKKEVPWTVCPRCGWKRDADTMRYVTPGEGCPRCEDDPGRPVPFHAGDIEKP